MNEEQTVALVVKTVSEFDAAFPTRDSQTLLTGYATLINELSHQITKNIGAHACIEVLVEICKEQAKGSNCNVEVHQIPHRVRPKGRLDA